MITYYIDTEGVAHPFGAGPRGLKGDRGAQGDSAYQVWLDEGNTGTVMDFYRDIAPDITPSWGNLSASGSTFTVPTNYSLVTLAITAPVELSFGDFVSSVFGTNPDGYSFTLHLTGSADVASFAPGVTVYGSIGTATDVWCTVIREAGAWKILVGVSS